MIIDFHFPFFTLFSFWEIKNNYDLLFSCVCLFIFGVGYEFFKLLKVQLIKRSLRQLYSDKTKKCFPNKNNMKKGDLHTSRKKSIHGNKNCSALDFIVFCKMTTLPWHGILSLYHIFLLTWSYLLMLAMMTMNPALMGSTIGGYALGYFIFCAPEYESKAAGIPQQTSIQSRRQDLILTKRCLNHEWEVRDSEVKLMTGSARVV
ncbi:uncharacterized protein LOC143464535 isoform X2 [Clavelina lepadiformis]|uniref:uncharacterized protein LOC143464535 isoform X2 n=1 Tax=Clavelina lepadiformis TaxID=159417 RepID=UPI00404353F6